MPAVNFQDSVGLSFDMPQGRTRIIAAEWAIHQGEPMKGGANTGQRPDPCTCLMITSVRIDDDGNPITEPFVQPLRATLKATTNMFQPSDDGEHSNGNTPGVTGPFLVPVGADKALNNVSGAWMFMQALREAAFKADELEFPNPISNLVGTEGTVIHHKRDGKDSNGKDKVFTTPLLSQITKFPYETAAPAPAPVAATAVKGKPGPKPKPGPAATPPAPPATQPAPPPAAVAPVPNGFDATSAFQEALVSVCEAEKASGRICKASILLHKTKAAAKKGLTAPADIKAIEELVPTNAELEIQGGELGLFVVDNGNVVWV